ADPHLAAAGPGAGARADLGRDRQAHGYSCGQSAQGAQDRPGAYFAGDTDRRRRRFAFGRLHRRPVDGLAGRSRDQREPERPDRTGPQDADPARRESHQDAVWFGRRLRAHTRRSRPVVRGYPRTYPPDRSQGPAQAAPSLALTEAESVYGWNQGSLADLVIE